MLTRLREVFAETLAQIAAIICSSSETAPSSFGAETAYCLGERLRTIAAIASRHGRSKGELEGGWLN